MSRSWASGHNAAHWRKVRALVLHRDGYVCQIRRDGCTHDADQVHHLDGRRMTGDDPERLVAACKACNIGVGNPMLLESEPDPEPRSKWA